MDFSQGKSAIVIPGGGSPLSPTCAPMYDLLRKGGQKRNWNVDVLDYVGCGHGVDEPEGSLALPEAVGQVGQALPSRRFDRIVGFSFGATVAAALAAHCPTVLGSCRELVWYAPVPWEVYQRLYGDPEIVRKLNQKMLADKRGARLLPEFMQSMEQIEQLVTMIRGYHVRIVIGTNDRLTSPAFGQRLVDALKNGENRAELSVIQDATHEMKPTTSTEETRGRYLDALFSSLTE